MIITRRLRERVYSLLKRAEVWDLLILLVISLVTLTWFRNYSYINKSDFGLALDRMQYYKAAFYSWDPRYSTGQYNSLQSTTLLFGLTNGISVFLGISLPVFERILFYSWFAISGLSAYLLCYTVGGGRLARLTSALLYMMNPYSLIIVWQVGQGMIQTSYAFFPLMLGLYINGVKRGRSISYAILISAIWAGIGFFGPLANLHMTALYWLAIMVYFLVSLVHFYLAGEAAKLRRCLKFTSGVICFYFLFNVYWIIPVIFGSQATLKVMAELQQFAWISQLQTLRLNSVNLFDAFKLSGYWALVEEGWPGVPYFMFGKLYNTPLFLIISLIIPLLATIPLLKKKGGLQISYLSILLLLGLFLMKGTSPPFGGILEYLFTHFLSLQIFRSGWVCLTMLTLNAMSPLCGIGLETLHIYIKNKQWHAPRKFYGKNIAPLFSNGVVCLTLFLLFVVLAIPFWTGDVVQTSIKPSLNPRLEIPSYYPEFKEWLEKEQGDFRIGVLPLSKSTNTILSWFAGGYTGAEPLLWYSNRPVMYHNTLTPLYKEMLNSLSIDASEGNFDELLGFAGVKYLVVHEDANWEMMVKQPGSWFPKDQKTLNLILEVNEFKYVKTIGKLSIYENPSYHERIYATNKIIDYQGDRRAIVTLLGMNVSNLENVALLSNGSLDYNELDITPSYYQQKMDAAGFDFKYTFNSTQTTDYVLTLRGNVKTALVDGRLVELTSLVNTTEFETTASFKKVELWKAAIPSAQDLVRYNDSIMWVIDGKVTGDRALVFSQNRVDLLDKSLSIPIINENVTGTMRLVMYDTNDNFAWWDFNLDPNEEKVQNLILNEYNLDGTNGDPLNFKVTEIKGLTIYYTLLPEFITNNSYVMNLSFPRILDSLQSKYTFFNTEVMSLSKGAHSVTVPYPLSDVSLLLNVEQQDNPQVTYYGMNPVEYQLKITTERPFILVFDETYNSGWRLFDEKVDWRNMFDDQQFNASHFMVNGYANGWYIDKVGTYDLTIYFKPQLKYFPLIFISITCALISILYVLIKYRRTKKKNPR